ncbi:hypothetical protein K523DRAFT_43121 [Schizophyllum commune Tattone D]|nr:hypothetical protein K523DRAFT_43121 [Schizophyllum commune Tattone D]
MCIGPGFAEPRSHTLVHLRFPSFTFSILPLGAPLHSFLRVGVGGDAYSSRPRCASVVGVGVGIGGGAQLGWVLCHLLFLYFSGFNSTYLNTVPRIARIGQSSQFQPPSIAPAPAQFFYISGIFSSCSEFQFLFSVLVSVAATTSLRLQLLQSPFAATTKPKSPWHRRNPLYLLDHL